MILCTQLVSVILHLNNRKFTCEIEIATLVVTNEIVVFVYIHFPGELTSTQCTTAWAVTGVAVAAVVVLLTVVIVESAIMWHQQR